MKHRAVLLLCLLGLGAADAPPASPPSPPSSSRPAVDQSRPEGALGALYLAMSRGEAEVVRDSYAISNASEEAVVQANAELARSFGRLSAAAVARWGENGYEALGIPESLRKEVGKLQAVNVAPAGDAAEVTLSEGRPSIHLVRVDGQWRIDVTRTFGRDLASLAARTRAIAGCHLALADEIAAGKYRFAMEARQAREQKLTEALRRLAASRPATVATPRAGGE